VLSLTTRDLQLQTFQSWRGKSNLGRTGHEIDGFRATFPQSSNPFLTVFIVHDNQHLATLMSTIAFRCKCMVWFL
jgi:hypothetical protein